MRSIIHSLTLAAGLLIGPNVLAQASLIFFGGSNYSSVDDSELEFDYSKTGIIGGVKVDIPLGRFMSLEAGLMHNTHGGKNTKEEEQSYFLAGDFIEESVELNERFHLKYLTVPIFLKGSTSINDNFKLSAAFGPYAAYGIRTIDYEFSCLYERTVNGELVNSEYYSDIGEMTWDDTSINSFDWGLGVQIGAEYRNFILSAFYNFGLRSFSEEGDYRTRMGGLSLGYRIPLKK